MESSLTLLKKVRALRPTLRQVLLGVTALLKLSLLVAVLFAIYTYYQYAMSMKSTDVSSPSQPRQLMVREADNLTVLLDERAKRFAQPSPLSKFASLFR